MNNKITIEKKIINDATVEIYYRFGDTQEDFISGAYVALSTDTDETIKKNVRRLVKENRQKKQADKTAVCMEISLDEE